MAGLSVIFMGFGFPAYLAYLAAVYNLNIWFVGIFTFLSLLGAAGIAVVYLGVSSEWIFGDDDEIGDRHKNVVETLQALVERMDELYESLKDIDDMLKMEE